MTTRSTTIPRKGQLGTNRSQLGEIVSHSADIPFGGNQSTGAGRPGEGCATTPPPIIQNIKKLAKQDLPLVNKYGGEMF